MSNKLVKAIIAVFILLASIFGLGSYATKTSTYSSFNESLDDKRNTVLELTAASATASAAITLIPGDGGTPIAEKLADFTEYFLIVICVIFLEKYLLVLTGFATFKVIIPIACIAYIYSLLKDDDGAKRFAKKISAFGIAIVLLIPSSAYITKLIEDTYASSIQETITMAEKSAEMIQKNQDDEKWYTKIVGGFSSATQYLEYILNSFIESLAIMLVTACIMPILVIVFFYIVIKMFFAQEIKVSKRFLKALQEPKLES